jgi:hypothetical protein
MVSKVQKEKIAMALMDAHNDDEFPNDVSGIIALIDKATVSDKALARNKVALAKAEAKVEKLKKLVKA